MKAIFSAKRLSVLWHGWSLVDETDIFSHAAVWEIVGSITEICKLEASLLVV